MLNGSIHRKIQIEVFNLGTSLELKTHHQQCHMTEIRTETPDLLMAIHALFQLLTLGGGGCIYFAVIIAVPVLGLAARLPTENRAANMTITGDVGGLCTAVKARVALLCPLRARTKHSHRVPYYTAAVRIFHLPHFIDITRFFSDIFI